MNKVLLACLLLASNAAGAVTTCRLVSSGSLAFGSYNGLAIAPADSLASVSVSCDRVGGPPNAVVTLALAQGAYGSSVNARRMAHAGGSGDFLSYGLFRDVARTAVWGNTPGQDAMSQSVSISNKSSASLVFTIYGRIPALQDVHAGSYGDSIQMTLTP